MKTDIFSLFHDSTSKLIYNRTFIISKTGCRMLYTPRMFTEKIFGKSYESHFSSKYHLNAIWKWFLGSIIYRSTWIESINRMRNIVCINSRTYGFRICHIQLHSRHRVRTSCFALRSCEIQASLVHIDQKQIATLKIILIHQTQTDFA